MLTQDDIKKLKVAKYKCKSSLLFFTRYFFKKRQGRRFVVNEHHEIICNALEKVIKGETKRLIINIAPRYSKTEIAVKNMVAHCLALNPKARFIHLSYSDDLALDNSEEIKDLIQSEEYKQLFNIELKKDSKSKKKWYTTQGGGVYATSAAGQVTGFGAGQVDDEDIEDIDEFLSSIESKEQFGGAIIIDDPIKPEDADSDTKRERVNQRFDSTIRNRVNSRNTPIIIIMQRLHENDICGYLEDVEPDEWDVIKLPVIKEDGTALWEFKHTIDELRKLEKLNEHVFSRQYMQNPKPLKGLLFPKEKLNRFSLSEYNSRNVEGICGYIDTADEGTDNLSYPTGELIKDKVYITDIIFTKDGTDITIPLCAGKTNSKKTNYLTVESNSGGKMYGKEIRQLCPGTTVLLKHNTANKHTRILMQAGFILEHCYFREDYEDGSDYDRFMKQLTSYLKEKQTGNPKDDAPDSLAGLTDMISKYFNHLYH